MVGVIGVVVRVGAGWLVSLVAVFVLVLLLLLW